MCGKVLSVPCCTQETCYTLLCILCMALDLLVYDCAQSVFLHLYGASNLDEMLRCGSREEAFSVPCLMSVVARIVGFVGEGSGVCCWLSQSVLRSK